MLEKSPIRLIGCTREDCAGFAADAYARLNGIGGGVRHLLRGRTEPVQFDRRGLRREVAGGGHQRLAGHARSGSTIRCLHHRVKDFHTQAEVFRRICCAEAELDDPHTALREIDRVLAAVVRHRRPGYIELPRDMVERGARRPAHADPQRRRPAIRSRWPRPSARRSAASPPPSGR